MALQKQPADPMVRHDEKEGAQAIFGTSLHRLSETIDNQPMDQESTEFYAGDIRDCCALCDPSNKTVVALRESIKNQSVGASVSLAIADVKSLVRLVLNPPSKKSS